MLFNKHKSSLNLDALELSYFILSRSIKKGKPINNYCLQNLLFFLKKEFLKKYKILIFEDTFEANDIGPFIPTVFYKFCGYGSMDLLISKEGSENLNIEKKYLKIIDEIIDKKLEKTYWEIVEEIQKDKELWDCL